jgi:hypothetical protein
VRLWLAHGDWLRIPECRAVTDLKNMKRASSGRPRGPESDAVTYFHVEKATRTSPGRTPAETCNSEYHFRLVNTQISVRGNPEFKGTGSLETGAVVHVVVRELPASVRGRLRCGRWDGLRIRTLLPRLDCLLQAARQSAHCLAHAFFRRDSSKLNT